jgi:hypothetical protein
MVLCPKKPPRSAGEEQRIMRLGRRPLESIVLALVAAIAGISDLVLSLQFLDVIEWGKTDPEFWGGRFVGALFFGVVAFVSFVVSYGWIMLRPWALMITLLMSASGVANPLMAMMAGTETWSTALGPIVLHSMVLVLALRPATRNAVSTLASTP